MTSLTNDQIIAELKWTEAIINEVCGITPKYFRPPFGDIDDRVRAIAKQLGFIPVVWDLDTNDWQLETGNTLITPAVEDAAFQRWASLASQDAHGHICLQHEHTASSVNEAIKNIPLLKRVFTVVPVSTCIRDSYPYKEPIFFPVLAPNSTTITSNLALMATRSLIAVPSSSATPIPSSTQNGAAAQMNRSMWVIIAALVGTVLGM
ncbi:hypothetical protein BC936DRAFT_137467 [Jimgerdemannia flammicorona]|uniref:NodB homology domain-containing protein n=1 Tax=Jimgerdemannia flammicorona TaxID=994334 RepID=A0A433CX97_9FUNG|nr:hypothetical protein BC936DRAFT_137467 [Jimgerdemannia flammicorona]